MSAPNYKKVPGLGVRRGFFAVSVPRCRLWVGDDHLLLVETLGGYHERYKRFYFKDIKAITICKTKAGFRTNIYMTVLCLIFGAGLFANSVPLQTIAGILFLIPFLVLITNSLQGPTCETNLLSAVQNETIYSMQRISTAQKALALLMPLIQSAQSSPAAESSPDSPPAGQTPQTELDNPSQT